MVDPLSYFSFQPVLHDWYNKGRGMCYSVCGMVHIKEPLLLIGKSSPCGGSGFPLTLSEWFFTICPTPYNRKLKTKFKNVLSASLNKTFNSFLPYFLASFQIQILTGSKQCVIGSTNLNVLLIPSQHNKNVLSASLNKTFNSFLPYFLASFQIQILTGPKQCVIGSTNLNELLIPSQHFFFNVLSASLNKTFPFLPMKD